jgi:hypothetical protein
MFVLFMAFKLYFNHCYSLGVLFVILSFVGAHQGDMLVRLLFALIHFRTLCCSLEVFLSCFFLSLAIDTHILNHTHVFSFTFDNFVSQLAFMGLFVQPCKCSS